MYRVLQCHMTAFALGYLLDLIIGDPHFLPHPVCLIGNLIKALEKKLLNKDDNDRTQFHNGIKLAATVTTVTFFTVSIILLGAYYINIYFGTAVETVMTFQILAVKSLKDESMKVYHCLERKDLTDARSALSMIVGRDTGSLSETKVIEAAVETVAENTSDGVVSPMLYTALAGPILGFVFKSVSTMDSMIGYKNDKYMYFGTAGAKLDDVWNYIPARISSFLMIAACALSGKEYDTDNAIRIYIRDRHNHKSPNAAHTEAVCAGALSVRLAGDSSYFGKTVKKPFIGEGIRSIEYKDIKRINHLMYMTAFLCEILCLLLMAACLIFIA